MFGAGKNNKGGKKSEPKTQPQSEKKQASAKPEELKKESLLELLKTKQPSLKTRLATALEANTKDAYELKRACRCLQETIYWLKQLEGKKHV